MQESFYLKVIGRPVVRHDGQDQPLSPERRHQVLAYLACRNDWVSRVELATMFWQFHDEAAARGNLRRLLFDMRQIPWAKSVEVRRDALRWRVDSDLLDFSLASSDRRWPWCVKFGAGAFLDGMERNASEAFRSWVNGERERIAGQWRHAVACRRMELRTDPAARVELALAVLEQQPHDESAVLDAVDSLSCLGRSSEARILGEQFHARVRRDLDAAPTARTHDSIGDGGQLERVPGPEQSASTEGRARPMVGRRLERIRLLELLRRKDCRVLTIQGPGGAGKSFFAQRSRPILLNAFPDGVHWVAMRDLVGDAHVPARIAKALGTVTPPRIDPLEAVASQMEAARTLLIFDGCEELPGVASIVERLVRRCRHLKIILTSRRKTGCSGESILTMEGLPYPDFDEREHEILRNFDAVRFFEICAREADPLFDLNDHLDDVLALIRRVEGLPLAIELSAASIRLVPTAAQAVIGLHRKICAGRSPATRATIWSRHHSRRTPSPEHAIAGTHEAAHVMAKQA